MEKNSGSFERISGISPRMVVTVAIRIGLSLVTAASTMASGLQRVALLVAALFGWILYGTNEVAHERWEALPPSGLFGVVGLLVAQALWLVVSASRAVSREVAAEQGGG